MPEQDYGKTISLPKTEFPRRAGLAAKEPLLIERWQKMDLYGRQQETQQDRPLFVLHDGPPYANGHLHMGHALNKILKDVVIRSKNMQGFKTPYVPGYDCHGLPIEWKIEEKYRKAGLDKDKVDMGDFRQECRDFAQSWVGVQNGEFQRLGVNGDWDNPYLTMLPRAEAMIVSEIHKFAQNGGLYRGSKPVMWSVPEKTALAEAEVEYKDHTSDMVWIKFPIKQASAEISEGEIVIWTTTPWTLPANRGVAYGEDIDYVGLKITAVDEESTATTGDIVYVARALVDDFKTNAKITDMEEIWSGKGTAFAGMVCRHPLHAYGYDFDVPVLPADFVTTETGTGFVHCAPSHGEDDYKLGLQYDLEMPYTVNDDGTYSDQVPVFAGVPVYTAEGKKGPANKLVMEKMLEAGALMAKGQLRHSYPHSWRSKAPVIFRNTPQWFISMDANDLRQKALSEIKKTRWVPERGENRISSMVENRGDWCISRQRAWGVPIAIFTHKDSGEILQDQAVYDRIFEIFEQEGSDSWFSRPAQDFLGDQYAADDYEQVRDIIDVWFESGSTHGFVCEDRPELRAPADLYLEGSDQHRGWFQSSLLVSTATRGHAPFKTVLTHGFVLDQKGYKMAKSEGNVISPMDLAGERGADILRLWVVGSDYTSDLKIGPQILKGHVDIYLRIRNTLCFLLGNLSDFEADKNAVSDQDLTALDQYILHRLTEVDAEIKAALETYDLHRMISVIHHLCNNDLSALYFDINKDNLYCNAKDSTSRRGCQTVLDRVFDCLVKWLAPVLCFTAEEAWLSRKGLGFDDLEQSVHFETYPEVDQNWKNDELKNRIEALLDVRRVVTGAIEVQRRDKVIRSSLEAKPVVYFENADQKAMIDQDSFADFVITSDITLADGAGPDDAFRLEDVSGISVVIDKAEGQKCERCWKYTDMVGADADHPQICQRCATVVKNMPADKLSSVA
jgi:isoleucyl-tRNA synthetase